MFKKSLKKIAIGSLSLIFSLFMVSGACASQEPGYDEYSEYEDHIEDGEYVIENLERELNCDDSQKINFMVLYRTFVQDGEFDDSKIFTVEDYAKVINYALKHRQEFIDINTFEEETRFSPENIYDVATLLNDLSDKNGLKVRFSLPLKFETLYQKARFRELYNAMVSDRGGESKDMSRNFFEDELDKVEDFVEFICEVNKDGLGEIDKRCCKVLLNLLWQLRREEITEKEYNERYEKAQKKFDSERIYREWHVFLNSILKYNGLPTFYPGIPEYQPN